MTLREILGLSPVVPLLVVEEEAAALPLARALAAGGLRVLEVALRSPAATEAVRMIAREVPEAIVGAGTVTRIEDLQAALDAGARFAVSPGFSDDLAAESRRLGLPYLPGVMTPSEVMRAAGAGFSELKFFPAAPAGGVAMLKALAGPFPHVRFCPTGGITHHNFRDYLALDNVLCVGGSWVAPPARVQTSDWAGITALAREASRR